MSCKVYSLEEGGRLSFTEKEKAVIQSLVLDVQGLVQKEPSNLQVGNPLAVKLGKYIFNDPKFSKNGKVSCAKCHQENRSFTDGFSKAFGLHRTNRNTPSLYGVGLQDWFYWDGRRDSLWSQALVPFEVAEEMGVDRLFVVKRVFDHPVYSPLYSSIFGEEMALPLSELPGNAGPFGSSLAFSNWEKLSTVHKKAINRAFSNVGKVIAAYERTLTYPYSAFDVFADELLKGKDASGEGLSISAQKGLKLFIDSNSTRCIQCHNGPRFSNGGFHNIGTGSFSGNDIDLGRSLGMAAVVLDEFNCLGEYSDAPKVKCRELRFMQNDPHNMSRGAFKTPSLRNVSKTGPYYHDGRFKSLEEVIHYYQTPPATPYGKTHELTPLTLTPPEIGNLLDFLREL